MSAEHHQALADLETSKREALAGLRAQLAQTTAEQSRLAARLEEQEREHDRMSAEHRRAIADLQTSKREALAECERVLTEIQQELLVRDEVSAEIERRLLEVIAEIERRLLEVIDEAVRQKVGGERLAGLERPPIETIDEAAAEEAHCEINTDLQVGLTQVVSETQTMLTDVEPLREVFDAADEAFVCQLIGIDEPAPKATDRKDPVFDAEDDAFVRRLMRELGGSCPDLCVRICANRIVAGVRGRSRVRTIRQHSPRLLTCDCPAR